MKQVFRIFTFVFIFASFAISCSEESDSPQRGQVTFSMRDASNGRATASPSFVNYTIEKEDGSTISDKIELISFGGNFITEPQQFDVGSYKLILFVILDENNNALYATPVEGSELADLVEDPLPISFEVDADETTGLVPEVLAVDDHSPSDFGYVEFGFDVIETLRFDISTSIVSLASNPPSGYTLEIIAKDAPKGNIQWTKSVSLTAGITGDIIIPGRFAHYTFKATKPGYVPHVQHYLKDQVKYYSDLSFEFIPENLSGLFMKEIQGPVTYYIPDIPFRCKMYARIDIEEGYQIDYIYYEKSIQTNTTPETYHWLFDECLRIDAAACNKTVNLFQNHPFFSTLDFCATIPGVPIPGSPVKPLMSFGYMEYHKIGTTSFEFKEFTFAYPGF